MNKADGFTSLELLRIYGSLMWNFSQPLDVLFQAIKLAVVYF